MGKKEKEILKKIAEGIEKVPEEKKEYIKGLVDGMGIMSQDRKKEEK